VSEPTDSSRERLLNDVIAGCLKAIDEGRIPDQRGIVAQYPSIASELNGFFANQQQFERFARDSKGLRTRAIGPTAVETFTDGNAHAPDAGRRERWAPRETIEPGSIFAGRYRVFGLARGGMGRVYFADDLTIGLNGAPLKVAIKSVADFSEWQRTKHAEGATADAGLYVSLLARFRREALAWIRLGMHANIIWAMWVVDHGAKPHLVMEFANGGDLSQWIRDRRLTLPIALNFAIQFCEGMKHSVRVTGMVHRDIKPANVLIKDDQILKISDFGLAKAFDPYAEEISSVSESDYGLSDVGAGTRAYMAPEQFLGLRLADSRSDIFSFGATLYEMLTGQRPFASFNSADMARHSMPIPAVHELDGSIPARLSTIVARCLDYDRARRFQSFDDLSAALSEVHAEMPGRIPIPADLAHERRAARLTPSLQLLAETYTLITLGRYGDAVACADEAIAIDPTNFEHWVNKGKALAELEQFQAARDCWTEATRLNPDDARAWANLGWAQVWTGNATTGLDCAERAIANDREYADGWMCRGAAERALGQTSHAVRSLLEAVRLDPHDWKTHLNLGYCLQALQRYDEALDSLTRASTINPRHADCWLQLGWLHTRRGTWRQARQAFDVTLQIDPSRAAAWAMRAWALWCEGTDLGGARASLRRALEIDPHNHQAQIVSRVIVEGHS
jgi:tetratricopeptide (TPR) repeat protein